MSTETPSQDLVSLQESAVTGEKARIMDSRSTIEGDAAAHQPLVKSMEKLTVRSTTPDPQTHATPQISPHQEARTPAGGSPSTSQVSATSIGPTLALLNAHSKHIDLTPITRNTSSSFCDSENVVSPDDDIVDASFEELHGEHLALPSDLEAPTEGLGLAQVRGHLDEQVLREHEAAMQPVEFQRKYYTFTSRDQYEEAVKGASADDDDDDQATYTPASNTPQHAPFSVFPAAGLTQYQPKRDDDLETGVGTLPEEALQQIFAPRGTRIENKNHRLSSPIPLEERQGSIPSIRLANRLHGSTLSFNTATDNTEDYELEDEESLLYVRNVDQDDTSLSSRGSSLYLPDNNAGTDGSALGLGPSPRGAAVVMEELNRVIINAQAQHAATAATSGSDEAIPGEDRRKRKQLKREEKQQEAMNWLQSVEADQNMLAEAASSKFLTGRMSIPSAAARRQTMPPTVVTMTTSEDSEDVAVPK